MTSKKETVKKASGIFKDHEPGIFQIDVKYIPRTPDEEQRGYLFTAGDLDARLV
ncbi:MAG: hypothetical protein ACRESZ_15720 [Methylococcales bacterium]